MAMNLEVPDHGIGDLPDDHVLERPGDGDVSQDKNDPDGDQGDGQESSSLIPEEIPDGDFKKVTHSAFPPFTCLSTNSPSASE